MKFAQNEDDAWDISDKKTDQPHGWIQWKGTDVCMDIHCECGELSHIDASFTYNIKCPYCGRIYFCNGHIELIELKEEPHGGVIICDSV